MTRFTKLLGAAALSIAVVGASAVGQVRKGSDAVTIAPTKAPTKPYVAPKTPDGVPDLQGYWTNNTIVPLQRAQGVTKEYYTPEEAVEAAKKQAERDEQQTTPGTVADVHYDFTQFGLDKSQTVLTANLRTSMITSPATGRIPALTAEATKRGADIAAERKTQGAQYDKVQNIPIGSRCIYQGAGPPMLPPGYNPAYQIVQGPGYVMVLVEAGHEVRVIPTDARPHPPASVRQWLGDSKGRWEGNTLVVETTNFNNKVVMQGANTSEKLKITERFTRTNDETIRYEFTVDDPGTWTSPWTAELPFTKMDGPIFEHACHEGNYGILNTLSGVRLEERKAAEEAAKKAGSK